MAAREDKKQPGKPRQTEWMRVMTEGQLTRDTNLRTRDERERDKAEAQILAERRAQSRKSGKRD